MILEVERLEDRLVLTPPRPGYVPPVGTWPHVDELPVAAKKALLDEYSTEYDEAKAVYDSMKAWYKSIGVATLTAAIVPLGYYVYAERHDRQMMYKGEMIHDAEQYWYIEQGMK